MGLLTSGLSTSRFLFLTQRPIPNHPQTPSNPQRHANYLGLDLCGLKRRAKDVNYVISDRSKHFYTLHVLSARFPVPFFGRHVLGCWRGQRSEMTLESGTMSGWDRPWREPTRRTKGRAISNT